MSLNWVDVIMLAVFVWGIHLGRTKELMTVFLLVIGALLATGVAFHLYSQFGLFSQRYFLVPHTVKDFFSFSLIWISICALFFILKGVGKKLIKFQFPLMVEKWGSMLFAVILSITLGGLLYGSLVLMDKGVFAQTTKSSFSGKYLHRFSLGAYETFYRGLRFIVPKAKYNHNISRMHWQKNKRRQAR